MNISLFTEKELDGIFVRRLFSNQTQTEKAMRHASKLIAITGLGLFFAPIALAGQPLGFLTGHWCLYSESSTTEEIWLPPGDGETVGMGRTLMEGKQVSFEFLRISRHDGLVTYFAQPGGRPAVEFKRTDGGEDWVRFENPQHDFPTRIEYRRSDATLDVTVSGPGKNGAGKSIHIVYEPCEKTQDRK